MTKVFVNGTFDVIHPGHIRLLETARRLAGTGGSVVVAIDSDDRVKSKKGMDRPVFSQEDRLFVISSLRYVDLVRVFHSDEELEKLIKDFNPWYMVKGSDYIDQPVIGSNYCKQIVYVERNEYSTSKILQSTAVG
jgi:D-beta-D-heptose 7-phosphate kinase/D-beta-D-heptose 1-phosphate adenosyltransferase